MPAQRSRAGRVLMRILVYNWRDLTHPSAGGAEVYTDRVTREWARMGHDVTLFASRSPQALEQEDRDGVRIVRRGGRHSVYREARRFYETEPAGRYDLVVDEVNTRPFGCPGWVRDAPVMALIHQVCREVWFHETALPVALMGRYVLEPWWLRAYRDVPVVTLSESSRGSLEHYGLRKVSVVPVGFEYGRKLEARPPKETVPTLAFVGRLTPNKRPHHVIEAFVRLRHQQPGTQLWMIGEGPMRARLERKAPAGVVFFDHVDDAKKLELLARAHLLVVTSVREGWGLVVTEAATVGTPTIAYDVAGLRDSVRASGGVLVEARPSVLAKRLANLLPDWASKPPRVAAGGVISWASVAEEVLEIVGSGTRLHAKEQKKSPETFGRPSARAVPEAGLLREEMLP
ncbi:MAG: glycosyltransferase family 4 protein [Acidimicrobiales bacterium]